MLIQHSSQENRLPSIVDDLFTELRLEGTVHDFEHQKLVVELKMRFTSCISLEYGYILGVFFLSVF